MDTFWAEYEYERVKAAAWAEYARATAPALDEYERVAASALDEYVRVRAPNLAEYERVKASALDEYVCVTAAAWAEYARALSNRVELTTRKENDMKHEISVDDIPGTVRQVWGGWVWVLPGEYELAWTKRRSEESCTTVVLDYVRREGVEALSDHAS